MSSWGEQHETEKICSSGFYLLGFLEGERSLSVTRLVCTLVTVSIISSWYSRRKIGKMTLFFVHWISGLVHLLANLALERMVLLCWLDGSMEIIVRLLTFVELVGVNMLAATNVAICVNLALIVRDQRSVARVKSLSSPWMLLGLFVVCVVEAAVAAPYWDVVAVSGTYFYTYADSPARLRWIIVSVFLFEAIAGGVMVIVTALLVVYRWPELRQVWTINRRMRLYLILTAIAIFVNVGIAFAGCLVVRKHLGYGSIFVTWIMRYVHIALDTCVLSYSLDTPAFAIESEMDNISGTSIISENNFSPPTQQVRARSETVLPSRPRVGLPHHVSDSELPGRFAIRWAGPQSSSTSIF